MPLVERYTVDPCERFQDKFAGSDGTRVRDLQRDRQRSSSSRLLCQNSVKTPRIGDHGDCSERRADSLSCCFFEKWSEREERLEAVFYAPEAGAKGFPGDRHSLQVSLTSHTRTRQL